MRKNKGITLIALVITIVILLILTGVTIAQLTENGLFEKVKLAKEKSDNSEKLENATLEDYEQKINEYGIISSSREDSVSEIIKNPKLILISKTSSIIKLQVLAENVDSKDIAAYAIFDNNNHEIKRVSENNEIIVQNLTQNTEYKFYARVLDKYGKFSNSTEVLTVKTDNKTYLYNEGNETQEIAAATGGYQGTLTKNEKYLFGHVNDVTSGQTNIPWWHIKDKIISHIPPTATAGRSGHFIRSSPCIL